MLNDKKFQSKAAVIFLVPHTTETKINSNMIHRKISKALFFFFLHWCCCCCCCFNAWGHVMGRWDGGGGGVLRTSTGRMNFCMYCNTSALCGHMMWGLTTLKKYFRFCQLTVSNCFDFKIIEPDLTIFPRNTSVFFAWHWLTAWLRRDLSKSK